MSNSYNINPTPKESLIYPDGVNIDANYGPWDSTAEYESWIKDTLEYGDPSEDPSVIYDGTFIAVKDPTSGILTHYVRENGAWREFGGGTEIDLTGLSDSLQDESGNTTLVSAINKAATLGPSGGSGGDYEHQITNPDDDTKIGGENGYITLYNIKEYLEPEYAPVWTDATCKISCTKDEGWSLFDHPSLIWEIRYRFPLKVYIIQTLVVYRLLLKP